MYRLVDQGHSVVGVDIYPEAISGMFPDAGLSPKVTSVNDNLTLYEVECVVYELRRCIHYCLTIGL